MREIRTYGSEGGGTLTRPPYPYRVPRYRSGFQGTHYGESVIGTSPKR